VKHRKTNKIMASTIFVKVRESAMKFLSTYFLSLDAPLPFSQDCTASTICPPSKSCVNQGGYFIYCEKGMIKDWYARYPNSVGLCLISAHLFVFFLFVKALLQVASPIQYWKKVAK
jgi:hypothetical protein